MAQRCAVAAAMALALGLPPAVALADPNDYVLTLDFAGGEHEIETKAGAASSARNGNPAGEAAAFGWGMGISDIWFTEVYAQLANSRADAHGGGLDTVSWENIARFAEPGRWPVDVGATVEIERSRAGSEGWTVTAGPLFQKDFDRLQVNLNLLLVRQFAAASHEATQLAYQFQVRYRAEQPVDFGLQALGGMGAWNNWGSPQGRAHRLGPAIFGTHRLSSTSRLDYNVAVLLGASRGAADTTVRAQIEYEY